MTKVMVTSPTTWVMVTSPTTTVLVAGVLTTVLVAGGAAGPVFVGYGQGIDAYKIRGVPIASGVPVAGQVLGFDGTRIVWTTPSDGSVGLADLEDFGADGGFIRSNGSAWVRVSGVPWADLTGAPATFPPSAHVHAAGDITSGVLADARVGASNVTQHEGALAIGWAQLTGVPSTFPPSAHTHPPAELTGFGAAGGYLRSDGGAWVRVSGLTPTDLTGPISYAQLPTGGGTWNNAGSLTFPDNLIISGGVLGVTPALHLSGDSSPLLIGHSAFVPIGGTSNWMLTIHAKTSSRPNLSLARWAAGASAGGSISMARSRSEVPGVFSALVADDHVGSFLWYADDGVDLGTVVSSLKTEVDGTPAANRVPGRLLIRLAEGIADDDLRTVAQFKADASFVSGLSAISSGAGFERNRATGSSTITPVNIRLRSTTNASDWLTGSDNPWAKLDFYSDDVSGPGAGARASISTYFEDKVGSKTGMRLRVSNASALADAVYLSSDLRAQFRGHVVVGQGEDTASPVAGVFRGVAASGSNTAGADVFIRASNGRGSGGSGKIRLQTAGVSTTDGVRIPTLVGAASSSAVSGASSITRTVAHTVVEYENGITLVEVQIRNASSQTVASITDSLGGVYVFKDAQSNGTNCRVEMWYLLAPTIGASTITITLSLAARCTANARTFQYVDQATPFGTVVKAVGNTLDATVTVASAVGELVVDVAAHENSGSTMTAAVGQTETHNQATINGTNSNNVVGGTSYKTGAASVVMSWTWVTTNRQWAAMGVPLKPATAYYSNLLADRMQLDAGDDATDLTPLLLRFNGALNRVKVGGAGSGPGGVGRALYFA